MFSLGHKPSPEELDRTMNQVDVDGNDTIDFPEFLSFMAMKMRGCDNDDDEELREAFNVFDRNRDGVIDFEELQQVMENLGEQVPAEDLQDMIREGGTFEAFKRMMNGKDT